VGFRSIRAVADAFLKALSTEGEVLVEVTVVIPLPWNDDGDTVQTGGAFAPACL
jgi:hypothetical protein